MRADGYASARFRSWPVNSTGQRVVDMVITDLAVFTSLGQPTIQIDVDRARAARYGLAPGDINATIRVAVGGDSAGDLYEPGSDRYFPIVVRLAPEYRRAAESIQNIRIGVQNPTGGVTQIDLRADDLFAAETAAQLAWTWYLLKPQLAKVSP